jgi:hypothetical protein
VSIPVGAPSSRRDYWLAVVLAGLVSVGAPRDAGADWIRLHEFQAVWSQVAVLSSYRIVQRHKVDYGTWAVDCSRSGRQVKLIAGGAAPDRSEHQDAQWMSADPAAFFEHQLAEFACGHHEQGGLGDKWLPHPGPPRASQWSYVGRHRNFRLTWVSFPEPYTTFWAIDCQGRLVKTLGRKLKDGRIDPAEGRWLVDISASGSTVPRMLAYACGS